MSDYKPSNTRWIYLQGKAKWAKLVTPDTKYGSFWSVMLYLNEASYKLFMELKTSKGNTDGILNLVRKDDDGYYVNLRRPTQKIFKGSPQGLAPPLIVEADGKSPLRNAIIGNGSDLTVKCSYYKYRKKIGDGWGSAIRLESVRVDTLVPYAPNRDMDEDQKKQIRGLEDQPEQLF